MVARLSGSEINIVVSVNFFGSMRKPSDETPSNTCTLNNRIEYSDSIFSILLRYNLGFCVLLSRIPMMFFNFSLSGIAEDEFLFFTACSICLIRN